MRIVLITLLAIFPILAQEPTNIKAPTIDDLRTTARAAYSKGKYADARTSLEQAWTLAQDLPPKDQQRYDVLKQLSGVLSASGDYAAAQDYVELAINWRETAVGTEDPKLADEWIELSSLCQRQKDYERALALLQRAQMTHIREDGPQSLPVADDFSRMALIYMVEEKPELATQPLQNAISIRESVLGAEHPAILSELDRLGAAWIALRNYVKAEDTFRRALVIRERLLGPKDAGLISTVEGLGYSLYGQKKYDEAEPLYMRLLSLWKLSTGDPAHPMVALTLDKIAVFYRTQNKWDEGTRAAEDANAIRELFLANGLSQDATARQAHGDKKTAAKLFAQALNVLDESRPEHDDLRAQLKKNLEELQIEVKPARKTAGKKSTEKY